MIPFYLREKYTSEKYIVLEITPGGEVDFYHVANMKTGEISFYDTHDIMKKFIYAGFKAVSIMNATDV
jgi:hypothetical protein